MNENLPTNVQLNADGNGTVSFATDVVATIAGLAATEVEGVASMVGGSTGGLAEIFKRGNQSATRQLTKGVKVEINENTVAIHLTIIVDYGTPVPDVARGIQENVKKAIETMSGLTVTSVDVHVQGVSFDKENRAAAEIEARQRLMLQKQQEAERAGRLKDEPVPEPREEPEKTPPEEPAPTEGEEEDEGEYVLELEDVEDEDAGDSEAAPEEEPTAGAEEEIPEETPEEAGKGMDETGEDEGGAPESSEA